MDSDTRLEQFLAGEAAKGLFLGEGEFQVALDKALEKLSRFSLPVPQLWVAKMVQAAVVIGAPKVDFVFERRKVTVTFANVRGWEAENLLQQLLQVGLPADSALRHLFTGFLGAAMGFTHCIEWACGEKGVTVDKLGPRVGSGGPGGQFVFTARRPGRSILRADVMNSPIKYLLRQTVEEYMVLIDRCSVAPIEITVDKRRLPGSYFSGIGSLLTKHGYDSDKPRGREVLLAQVPISGTTYPSLPYPIDSLPLFDETTEREEFEPLYLSARSEPVQAVICVYSCLQRESRLNLVMDGIRIQQRELFHDQFSDLFDLQKALLSGSEDLVLDVYLGVSWADLDLSQFDIQDRPLADRVLDCLPEIVKALELVHRECSKKWNLLKEPPEKIQMPTSIAGLLAMGFMPLFVPHVILIGSVVGCFYLGYKAVEWTNPGSKWLNNRESQAHESKVARLRDTLELVLERLRAIIDSRPANAES
ncbi:MAG: hypothetical protein WC314_08800 [Vulcanimicrobiota bacterium]